MKSIFVGSLIALMFLGIVHPDAAVSQDKGMEEVRFKWAFGALTGGDAGPQLVAVNRDTTLETGNALKMLLELQEACFAYVIHQGPQGEINLLFPYALSDLDAGIQESTAYYIPKGGGWFELDDRVGKETFHLLASAERLKTLEKLLSDYESAGSENKAAAARGILEEIQQLRRTHRNLKTAAERPVQIVGRIRGNSGSGSTDRPDIEPLAVEISAESFYSRTFTIDHR